ncbi:hypothetical protein OA92_02885 [Marinomonas sp. SBI22]|uniref:hypothetical protein n=1 Tax=unclassified Marinomonas TaxID=196814 RepID=UPI0007AFE07A|nr:MULTISPECIES: hypothetical protein [unclassified Marinomonas]KZM38911.1 hypothetical protein OA91_23275 [Marinomonas sp. SBI8L]KZM44833.1 hypothetical protein OA92_02885 [Marinomonas sp. SBI22]
MTELELLNKELNACASIHQPHGLKAFLAAQNVAEFFRTSSALSQEKKSTITQKGREKRLKQEPIEKPDIWQRTSDLIAESEIQVKGQFASLVSAPEFSEFRIFKVLDLGIYPAAYQAMSQWYQSKGFAVIFAHYLSVAASHNEYLSHNVTILLAFNRLYPQLDATQIEPFLDRFTEFVTSSFAGKRQKIGSVKQEIELEAERPIAFKVLINACLEQPSFFGHNLITLAWIMRSKAEFNEPQLVGLTKNLYQQATNPLDDPEDELDKGLFAMSQSSESQEVFELSLKHLVFKQCHNLHQVTLADALAFLYLSFPQEKAGISLISDYYVRVFASIEN